MVQCGAPLSLTFRICEVGTHQVTVQLRAALISEPVLEGAAGSPADRSISVIVTEQARGSGLPARVTARYHFLVSSSGFHPLPLHLTGFLLHLSRAWGHGWHFLGMRLEEVTPFLLPLSLRFLPCQWWGHTSVKGLFEVLENTLEIQWGSLGLL